MRGVTGPFCGLGSADVISTHTPHARRDILFSINLQLYKISTHTPHARRDVGVYTNDKLLIISTHTPHARRDFEERGKATVQ